MTLSSPAFVEKFEGAPPKFTGQLMALRSSPGLRPGVVPLLVLFFCVYAGYRNGDS